MTIIVLLGFTVGVILALTGAGGGILAVPLLVFGAGLSMAEAGPIGLLAVGLAAALGTVMGLKSGTVRYKAATLIAGAGIICSPLGLWLAQRSPNRPLTIAFSFVLLYVAVRVFQRAMNDGATHPSQENASMSKAPPPCQLDAERGKLRWTAPCARALALSGVVAGTLSGLLGVGGGFVMVPAMIYLLRIPTNVVVGTSLFQIIFVTAYTTVVQATTNYSVDIVLAFILMVAGVIGAQYGVRVGQKLRGEQLRALLALLVLAVGARLAVDLVIAPDDIYSIVSEGVYR